MPRLVGVNSLLFLPLSPWNTLTPSASPHSCLMLARKKQKLQLLSFQDRYLNCLETKAIKSVLSLPNSLAYTPFISQLCHIWLVSAVTQGAEKISQPLGRKSEAEQVLWKAYAVLRCLIYFSCWHFHLLSPKKAWDPRGWSSEEDSRSGVRNSAQSRT